MTPERIKELSCGGRNRVRVYLRSGHEFNGRIDSVREFSGEFSLHCGRAFKGPRTIFIRITSVDAIEELES